MTTLVLALALAAPAGKPDPAPHHVTGPLTERADSPTVVLPDGSGGEVVVWLVWGDPTQEPADLRPFRWGDRVTVRGRLGAGGKYKYLTVRSIEPAD